MAATTADTDAIGTLAAVERALAHRPKNADSDRRYSTGSGGDWTLVGQVSVAASKPRVLCVTKALVFCEKRREMSRRSRTLSLASASPMPGL